MHFSLAIDTWTTPGTHGRRLLVRSDVATQSGEVVGMPAVGAQFTLSLSVAGNAGHLVVRPLSRLSYAPVDGTIAVSRVDSNGNRTSMLQRDGNVLDAPVAAGTYVTQFQLGGRNLSERQVTVGEGQTQNVTLDVDTVCFLGGAAFPVRDSGKIVLIEAVASVKNATAPIPQS